MTKLGTLFLMIGGVCVMFSGRGNYPSPSGWFEIVGGLSLFLAGMIELDN